MFCGMFALFWMLEMAGVGGKEEGDTYKARLTTTLQSGKKRFSRQRGPHVETAVSSDSHLEIGHVVV